MDGTPLVSVVLPTYNRAPLLAEAVESVLTQTFADHELLVVDDGSTDHTPSMMAGLADHRVRLVSLPHSGVPARVRNIGVSRARGRWVAFLDSDDLWDATKLDDQLATLASRPECRWSHTGQRCVDEAGAPHAQWSMQWPAADGWIAEALIRRRDGVASSSVLADRAFLLEAGGFDETFVWGEDYDLWVRLALRSPIASVRGSRVRHRVHANQFTRGRRPRVHAPQLVILRTLGKTARSAASWQVRALCLREAARLGARYLFLQARGALRRLGWRRTEPRPAVSG